MQSGLLRDEAIGYNGFQYTPYAYSQRDRMRYPSQKDKPAILARLRKIAGQVRGLERMIEDDQYCIDILTQVASVRSALDSLGLVVLQQHIEGCVRDSLRAGDRSSTAKVDELIATVNRFIKA